MSQTTLLSSINRTTDYPITVPSTADSHCGTLQLILGSDWTNQMIHELPAINISILTEDGSKFISFDVNMSTVNEELRNKDRSLTPTEPYSIAIYDIPKDITFSITPLFDQYALKAHNDLINDGNIEIFETSDKGIVDTDSDNYSTELWTTPTSTFDITIIFDNSNVSSGGSGGGGQTPTAADVSYSGSSSGLTATNVQDAIDEVQGNVNAVNTKVDNLPEPMVFKGSLGTGGTTTTLPAASDDNKGFTYKVIAAGTYQGVVAEVGDTLISDGTAWVLIPSGDEPSGTVTNVAVTSADGSATITGSPITSSGTIDVSVVIDDTLSTTSVHPVQNKVITEAMNSKIGMEEVYGRGIQIPNGTDLHDITTPGSYYCGTSTGAATLLNCPVSTGFHLVVTSTVSPWDKPERVRHDLYPTGSTSSAVYSENLGSVTSTYPDGWRPWGVVYNIIDAVPTSGSQYAVTSGSVYDALNALNSTLTPISESAYEALATKDKPLYFIYD